jgi:hypothetical protein
VLSHIDLAWSYSYEELRVGGAEDSRRVSGSNRSLNFFHLMSKLVAGARAGAASLALKLRLGAVGAELNAHYDRCKRTGAVEGATPQDLLALGNLWMLHQDLLGFTLLGDPAVRLPLASPDPSRAVPDDPVKPRSGDPALLETLERAALAALSGDSPGVVAARHGLPRSEVIEAAEAYRTAGRAALSALLAPKDPGPEKGRGS